MSDAWAAGVEELQYVDEQLRKAERKLLAAHQDRRAPGGPRPEVVFQEVLWLREKTRKLLARLGEELLAAETGAAGA